MRQGKPFHEVSQSSGLSRFYPPRILCRTLKRFAPEHYTFKKFEEVLARGTNLRLPNNLAFNEIGNCLSIQMVAIVLT